MSIFSFISNIFFVIAFVLTAVSAWAFPARVVAVADGDTLTVELVDGGKRVRVRLYGVDAPERDQPYGEAARVYVFVVALYKAVDVEPTPQGVDRYGRVVAVVYLPGGESLQAALLRAGLAWVWPRYCKNCHEWQEIQDAACAAGKGLWREQNPIPPWEWRKGEK